MRTMSPASTRGRNASCCDLLKRWISSTNRIVRRPRRRRASSASAITARISLIPDRTALNEMKCARVDARDQPRERRLSGARRAPQDDRLQAILSMARRSGRPGPMSASWPTNSSSVRGRMRSASGAGACACGSRAARRQTATLDFCASRGAGTLPRRLVEDQRGRDRDVQRFDRRRIGIVSRSSAAATTRSGRPGPSRRGESRSRHEVRTRAAACRRAPSWQ